MRFFLTAALATLLSASNAQIYTYSATVNTDPSDSCGRSIDMVTTGFDLPITNYVTDGSSIVYFSTTANPVNYCGGQYIYGYDQSCRFIRATAHDVDSLTPPLFVKSATFNVGGPSSCDNSLTFTVSGLQGSNMWIQLDDNDVIIFSNFYDNIVNDSTFTMSGFCLGDYAGVNEHLISITVWDTVTWKYCGLDIWSPPVGFIGGGACNSKIVVKAYPVPASDMVTCNGSVSSTVTGDNPPFTYAYSNGPTTPAQTGMCSGIYDLTVTDALGYSRSTSFIVADSANIYYDNPSQTPIDTLIAGAYMNCDIDFSSPIDSIYIDSILNLTPQIVRVTYIIVQDTNSYKWSESYYTDTAGYYCFITNVFCEDISMRAANTFFTAYLFGSSMGTVKVNEIKKRSKITNVYPNPASNVCFVMGLEQKNVVEVIDINGQLLSSATNCNGYISVQNLANGIYFIKILQDNEVITQKLLVKH